LKLPNKRDSRGRSAAQTPPVAPGPDEPAVSMGQAAVLGVVQGLTEFVPVSSSAHLNFVHARMGQGRDLNFDVLLGAGTTLASLVYFRREIRDLLSADEGRRLRKRILLSCVPALGLGLLIHRYEEKPPLSEPWFNGAMLALAGTFLWWADARGSQERSLDDITPVDALVVGAAQALALVPGVSRSGATITAGRLRGLNRRDAAQFAFLISLPVNLAAIAHELPRLRAAKAAPAAMATGIAASAATGFWSIGFLLHYLRTKDTAPFAAWRVAIGSLVLLFSILHHFERSRS